MSQVVLFSPFVFLGIHLSIVVSPLYVFFPNTGITNYEEYSLIQETVEEKKEDGMGTLKKDRTLLRDERKMEKLKAKLHTDDEREFSSGRCLRFTANSCFSCSRGSQGGAAANPSGLGAKPGSHAGQVTSLSLGLLERQTTIREPFTCWQRCRLVRLSPPQQTFNAHK